MPVFKNLGHHSSRDIRTRIKVSTYKNLGILLWRKSRYLVSKTNSEDFKNQFNVPNKCRYLILPEICIAKSETYVPCHFYTSRLFNLQFIRQFVNGTFLNCTCKWEANTLVRGNKVFTGSFRTFIVRRCSNDYVAYEAWAKLYLDSLCDGWVVQVFPHQLLRYHLDCCNTWRRRSRRKPLAEVKASWSICTLHFGGTWRDPQNLQKFWTKSGTKT